MDAKKNQQSWNASFMKAIIMLLDVILSMLYIHKQKFIMSAPHIHTKHDLACLTSDVMNTCNH